MHEAIPPSHPLPDFEVRLDPPDINDWLPGNTGILGVTSLDSGAPGPHVAISALMHGNEYSGAIVLDRLLRAGVRPTRGRLSLAFLNVEAFSRFDPRRPTVSRFIDEDMNRLWDDQVLDGPRRSVGLDRARELRPWLESVDVLLDLHSMLWPSDPVILCGPADKGRDLALGLGGPSLIVADRGHGNGRRLIDHPHFTEAGTPNVANLIEAGEHWDPVTVDVAMESVAGVLAQVDSVAPGLDLPKGPTNPGRFARVTDVITAATSHFAFVQPFRGYAVLPERNTLIAIDGEAEIRTPYDDCLLVLPSLRPGRGHTAVRLARFDESHRLSMRGEY